MKNERDKGGKKMGKGRMASSRIVRLAIATLTMVALLVLISACSSSPKEGIDTKSSATAVASNTDTGKQTDAKPASATSGCVNCHTSKENIKSTAAPPPPVVKSAEQSGEG